MLTLNETSTVDTTEGKVALPNAFWNFGCPSSTPAVLLLLLLLLLLLRLLLLLQIMRWVGHVARMEDRRVVYRVLVGKPEGKRPLGRPRRRWEDNIRMNFKTVWPESSWLSVGTGGVHL